MRGAGVTLLLAALAAVPLTAGAARVLEQAPQDPNAALPAPAAAQPASSLPPMLAYFPLLSGNLTSSYPDGAYQGAGPNLVAQQDSAFGAVLSCTEALRSYVSIPGLQYGQGGQLAVAMWVKAQPGPGSSMDYAFSHANALTTDLGMDPNVVALYLPERDHPDYGVARAMLRDSTDVRTNGSEPFYLDSDGCISTVRTCNPAGVRNDSLSVTDGQWHMLGVTTRPGGGKGFQLFVDGRMVAEAVEGVEYIDDSGFTKTATGGGPMNLTGNITLCARSDLEATRFFTGSLAHLLIFNTSLSPDNMLELYTTGRGFASALDQASTSQAPAAEEPSTLGGTVNTTSLPPGAAVTEQTAAEAAQPAPQCVTGCTDDGGRPVCYTDTDELILCITSTTAAPGPSAAAAASPLAGPQQAPGTGVQAAAQLAGQPLCSQSTIQGIATAQACAPGYTCAPLSRQQIAANFGAELGIEAGDIGVCAYTPHEVMLPSSDEVPPAVAFFPLNSQSLQSFPLPDYSGTASGAGVVSDELFGSALLCSREDQDLVALDAVQYARSGAFTVNLWFRPVNMSGDSLSYLFSHRGTSATSSATSNTGWGPNQIQLYLPDEGHPSYGILRTYVKDYNDAPTSQGAISFVDSDGNIAYDGERAAAEAAALYDGGWHMATVSSQPGGIKGYRLYLDGRLVGEVEEGRSYTTPTGFPIPIDGGDPMLLNGNVALCVRSDDPSGRHFDGTLAYLGQYDLALNDTQVELLYSAVAGNMNTAEEAASPPDPSAELPFLPTPSSPGAANITRLSASGQRCQFPVLYNGELVTDCIAISGVFSCQVAENVWEPCAGAGAGSIGQGAGSARYTTDGEECVFPALIGGNAFTNCTSLQAGAPEQCQTATGAWKPCAPLVSQAGQGDVVIGIPTGEGSAGSPASASDTPVIIAQNGSQCLLPLAYNGLTVETCVNIQGAFQCWGMETDDWEDCPQGFRHEKPKAGALGMDPAAATLYMLPSRPRQTTSGAACQLPVVDQGEILVDCVQRGGAWSCLTSPGNWEQCDLNSSPPPADKQGKLMVAQRTTLSGLPCVLPAVLDGYLSFDCLQVADADGRTSELCPTQESVWETCSSAQDPGQVAPGPVPFSTAAAFNRTAPGQIGMLCPLVPSTQPNMNCDDMHTCLPLPELSSNVTTPLTGLGFCAHPPIGGTFGAFQYFQAAKAPAPLAFFPLTEGSLQSVLVPAYGASLSGAPLPGWVDEPTFGRALNCSQEGRNAVLLDTVPYASNGSFAINLWMRRLPGSSYDGELHQYLYSHTGLEHATISGQVANKVQIYVPDRNHPAHGLIRTIVADSNDTGSVGAAPIYLDSDGSLNSEASNRTLKHSDVNDGGWHMVTVSTFPNGTRGYSVFVDGQQVASLSPATQLMNGSAPEVTGGDPARLTDAITLCARSDMDPARFFDGSLAHLTLFSHGLEPEAVAGLYATYRQNGTNASGAPLVTAAQGDPASSASPADGSSSGLTTGEIVGVVLASLGATMAVLTALVLFATHRRKRSAGKRFDRFQDEAPAGVEGGTVQDQFAYGGGRAPAAVPMAAVTRPSIQLSSGRSLSLGSAGNNPEAEAAAAEPRSLRPTLSDVSTTNPSNLGAQDLADEHDDATSMASVHSRMSDAVSVEPGRRSLVKRGGVRVVLPGVEEGEPRGPFDP